MIHHIVLFRLADKDGRTAAEWASEGKRRAESLRTTVHGAEALQVFVNMPGADTGNYHLMLHGVFPDETALHDYAVHEKHLEFVAFIKSVLAENGRACIDYTE